MCMKLLDTPIWAVATRLLLVVLIDFLHPDMQKCGEKLRVCLCTSILLDCAGDKSWRFQRLCFQRGPVNRPRPPPLLGHVVITAPNKRRLFPVLDSPESCSICSGYHNSCHMIWASCSQRHVTMS